MNEELENAKMKAKKALIKISDFMMKPSIRKASKFAAAILETGTMVDKKNPISVGTAALSMVDNALDAFEVVYPTKTEQFAKEKNLCVKMGNLPRLLIDTGVDKAFKTNTIFMDSTWAIKELVIDEQSKLYYGENTDTTAYYQDNLSKISSAYYHSQEFNFEKLFDAIWSHYPEGLFISNLNTTKERWDHSMIRLHNLSTEEYLYLGELDPDSFAEDIKKFRKEGISRSYMLAGDPGTGKSSFVIEVARRISPRIVKVDPAMAHCFSSNEFDFLIENLSPDILVFDDFDRVAMAQDSNHLLFLLESIKTRYPSIILFATVNHFDKLDRALVRPGRFDEILWFKVPNADVRRTIAEQYLKLSKIEYDPVFLEKVVEKTDGLTPVYIKELCIRLKHKGEQSLESIIEEFHKVLEIEPTAPIDQKSNKGAKDENDFFIAEQLAMDLEM